MDEYRTGRDLEGNSQGLIEFIILKGTEEMCEYPESGYPISRATLDRTFRVNELEVLTLSLIIIIIIIISITHHI
jgi:hypothetical protein